MPIFISYSHADADFVDRLAMQLVGHGVNVWLDRWEINVGDSLITKVQDAIDGASALLVVLSKASVQSSWVTKEVNSGLMRELDERKIVVLPVLVEDCRIPTFLREKFYADFTSNFDDGLRKILDSVAKVTNANTGRTDEPTFYRDWALDWDLAGDLAFVRLTFVEQPAGQPYTVLSTVSVWADDRATDDFVTEVELIGEDTAHTGLIAKVAGEIGDLAFRLTDQFEQSREFTIGDSLGTYNVVVSAQRLGEDTGRDVLYTAGNAVREVLQHRLDVAAKPGASGL